MRRLKNKLVGVSFLRWWDTFLSWLRVQPHSINLDHWPFFPSDASHHQHIGWYLKVVPDVWSNLKLKSEKWSRLLWLHPHASIKMGPFLRDDCSHQQNPKTDWQRRSHLDLAKGNQKLYRQMEMIQNKIKKIIKKINVKNNAFFSVCTCSSWETVSQIFLRWKTLQGSCDINESHDWTPNISS